MKNEFEQIETLESLKVKRWGQEFNKKSRLNQENFAEKLIDKLDYEDHFAERIVEETL